jgi:hypothetical protein
MAKVSIQQVTPGPCPPTGCPPATEIVCIFVPKVFDFCFEEDAQVSTTTIPTSCGTLPTGAVATATINDVTCTTGTAVPTGVDGFAILPVTVIVGLTVTIRNAACEFICSFQPNHVVLNKTIVVCHPDERVTCDCTATAVAGNELIVDGSVSVTVLICTIVECSAPVKLLVPSFGFCTPTRCTPAGFPPGFICPPTDLFPPQCTPTVG